MGLEEDALEAMPITWKMDGSIEARLPCQADDEGYNCETHTLN
jgi:hypothetical protein